MAHSLHDFCAASEAYHDIRRAIADRLLMLGYRVTPDQAAILACIAKRDMTVGEAQRHSYFGTNISYNIAKLMAEGFLLSEQTPGDRRSRTLSVTDKGRDLVSSLATRSAVRGGA